MENFTKETLGLLKKYREECKYFACMKNAFEELVTRDDNFDAIATYCDKREDNRPVYEIVDQLYDKHPLYFELIRYNYDGNYEVACERAIDEYIGLENDEYNLILLALNNGFFDIHDKEEEIKSMDRRFRELSKVGKAKVVGTVNSFTDAVVDTSKRFANHVIDVVEVDRDKFDREMKDAGSRFDQIKEDGYRTTRKALNKGTKKLIKVLERVVEKTEK